MAGNTGTELAEERFAQLFVETCSASEAYRVSHDYTGRHAAALGRGMRMRPRVAALIEELRKYHREAHDITIGSLLEELEAARILAAGAEQMSSMVSATMGKAKLLGFDKQVVEHTGKDGEPLSVSVNFVSKKRDDDAPMC